MPAIKYFSSHLMILFSLAIYGQSSFEPPYNLQAQVIDDNVQLIWNAPDTLGGEYISWDNGITGNAIGLSSAGGEYAVASRWDADQLTPWVGYTIDKVAFNFTGDETAYIANIWWGENADSVVWAQPVSSAVQGDWTFIFLNSPINVNNFEDLWVGYEVNQPEGEFPAGTDDGPAVAGYGDMINFNGIWESLSVNYFLDVNINVRAYLSNGSKSVVLGTPAKPAYQNYKNNQAPSLATGFPTTGNQKDYIVSEVIGYKVYRDNELIDNLAVEDTSYLDLNPGLGTFIYGVSAVYPEGESSIITIPVQVGSQEITVFPESIIDTVYIGQVYTTPLTVANTGQLDVIWIAYSPQSWLYGYPQVGYLQPDEQEEILVTIFTSGLSAGLNIGELIIYDGNPSSPLAVVPVSIYAIGSPMISITPQSLNFGDVVLGDTATQDLVISNMGFDTLQVNSIISTNPEFIVENIQEAILPYEEVALSVQYTANSLGPSTGTIVISSNDMLNPEVSVPVSANAYLQPPAIVTAVVDDTDVTLTWEMEISGDGDWVHFDSGESYTSIGLTQGGTWQYAARWFAGDLINYSGNTVAKVAFIPRDAETQYTLKIWKGENAQTTLVSQVINNIQVNEWNEVIIQNPFNLDVTDDIYVGFEVIQPTDAFPASVDFGPAVIEQGDMINVGEGWQSAALTYGLDFNWNIQLFILNNNSAYQVIAPNPSIDGSQKSLSKGTPIVGNLKPLNLSENTYKSQQTEILGFNVYRNDTQINEALLTENTYLDSGLEFGLYEYGVTAVYAEGESPQTTKLVQIGAAEISFDPQEIIDSIDDGGTLTHIIEIENTGNFVLDWSAVPSDYWISVSDSTGSLEPGNTALMTVVLNANALFGGTYNGNIAFTINNLNNPVVNFPIQLNVTGDAQLVITPDSVNFGLTAVNTQKTAYVTITNIGNDFIYIESMIASPEPFSTMSFPFYLFPGGTVSFPVYFTPEVPGDFSGMLVINTDGSGGGAYEIPLAGNSLLPIPMNLTATVDSNAVQLDWQSPYGGSGDYLQYSDDETYSALGFTGGGAFFVAAKFSPEELMIFNGGTLASVGFIPWSEDAFYTLKVWMGENAENLMISQPVGFVNGLEWNDIQLNMQIPVDTSEYLWIGYEVIHELDDYPAGSDFGPAVEGKGNLLSTDGIEWITLGYYGIDMNWNIRGLVNQGSKSMTLSPLPIPEKISSGTKGELISMNPIGQQNLKYNLNSLDLLGYNVYRNGNQLNDTIPLTETEFLDFGLEAGIYSYEVTAVYNLGESLPAGPITVEVAPSASSPIGWSPQPTPMTHIVHIPTTGSESEFMSPGDWIGVFYNNNGTMMCGGSIIWSEADSLKLIVYGDNPATPEKEGFEVGEWLNWMVFMSDTEEEHEIEVVYNQMMPNYDGNFSMLGESALMGMEVITTGMDNPLLDAVNIYPNPSNGNMTLTGMQNYSELSLRNAAGIEVYQQFLKGDQTLNLKLDQPSGMYYLILQGNNKTKIQKMIIQN